MVKKVKTQKKQKESNEIKESINLSQISKRTRLRLFSKKENDIAKINTTVLFKINTEPFPQKDFEKEYYKRYIFYMKEEFNSKVITMFFNYISSSKIIPNSFKNNRYFLKEFLKIIINLLINEIDLTAMTLIFDSMGWIAEGTDPWIYIYYICLYAKEKASSETSFSILLKILEKNNSGFTKSFNNWANNINNKQKLNEIDIIKINDRFTELKKPLYLKENQKKFINYNELVEKIMSISKQKDNNIEIFNKFEKKIIQNKNNILPIAGNINNINNINPQQRLNLFDAGSGLNINNKDENSFQFAQNPLDLQRGNSSFNDKYFDLSRGGSRNNSFMGLNSFDGNLYAPSMRFNNK